MKHIGIFNTSGDVQTAIANESLLNPYVAKVSGALDYNSVVPATMGTWSEETNSFTITETDYQTYWFQRLVYIGKFNGVYFMEGEEQSEVQPINMDLYLYYDGAKLNFTLREENDPYTHRIDIPSNGFNLGVAGNDIFEHTYIDPEESSGNIQIGWDGVDTFTFSGDIYGTLSVTKHNPEYPSPEESEASE